MLRDIDWHDGTILNKKYRLKLIFQISCGDNRSILQTKRNVAENEMEQTIKYSTKRNLLHSWPQATHFLYGAIQIWNDP